MGLSRRYLENMSAKPLFVVDQLKAWWSKATNFERKWTYAMITFIATQCCWAAGLFRITALIAKIHHQPEL